MGISSSIQGAILFFFLMGLAARNQAAVFNIKSHGAKGDGSTDDGPAIMAAWKEACASPQASSVLIPAGTYMTKPPVTLPGPCKAPIEFRATGATLKQPADASKSTQDGWITFSRIDKLTWIGGIYDGQGAAAWKSSTMHKTGKVEYPANIRLNFITNSLIKDITSKDSKFFHINVLGCDGTTFEHVTVDAPHESINTDGIHIGRTKGLNFSNIIIKTGDDCLSFGDGSKDITVDTVSCGPGHGISIGSLGKYQNEAPVEGIHIKHATITGTMNGVRIKTWPGSPAGIARDIHFEDVTVQNVGNPILIDQEYCPFAKCNAQSNPSKVKISNVSFKGVKGSSSTKEALKLMCSKSNPCDQVVLSDINLTYKGPEGGEAISVCDNVKPVVSGTVVPKPCSSPPGAKSQ